MKFNVHVQMNAVREVEADDEGQAKDRALEALDEIIAENAYTADAVWAEPSTKED